ncbi:hypothetical protein PTTW11_00120 [Pyrenophora teres f. teres]|uniref:Uncharacterized protein n=1 Tax=Pyrenophora teres f. teres TaxID=97479 RepID=A0A6S6V7S9_9PLEO|nr:hypothetical protein PTTW11_00120 [Pyrenophora teres f. teres]
MRIAAALWRQAAPIPRRTSTERVKELLGLSDEQWPTFLQVSLEVCKDYAGYKLSDISEDEKIRMKMRIKDGMRKKRLPKIDDEALEWRVSKCLPELRVKNREHCHGWEATTNKSFPRTLLKEAVLMHADKLPTGNLRYWSQIPRDVQLIFAEEANRKLSERDLPILDETALLYRLRKYMNHWLKSGLQGQAEDREEVYDDQSPISERTKTR